MNTLIRSFVYAFEHLWWALMEWSRTITSLRNDVHLARLWQGVNTAYDVGLQKGISYSVTWHTRWSTIRLSFYLPRFDSRFDSREVLFSQPKHTVSKAYVKACLVVYWAGKASMPACMTLWSSWAEASTWRHACVYSLQILAHLYCSQQGIHHPSIRRIFNTM